MTCSRIFKSDRLCLILVILTASQIPLFSFDTRFYQPPQSEKLDADVEKFCTDSADKQEMINAWIYFTDKQKLTQSEVQAGIEKFSANLTPRAIQRRANVLPADRLVDFKDLPVSNSYMLQIRETGARHRAISRWLNAISVSATPAQIKSASKLPFVRKITVVRGFKRSVQSTDFKSGSQSQLKKSAAPMDFDYGESSGQLQQILVPELHRQGYSGKNVLVCMMDTGFRKTHEALRDATLIAERDFIFDDNDTQRDPTDPYDSSDSHGTSTWSALGGLKNGRAPHRSGLWCGFFAGENRRFAQRNAD